MSKASKASAASKNSGSKARKTSEDQRVPAKKSKAKSSSSDSSSDSDDNDSGSDSSSDAKPAAKKAAAKKDSSSDSGSDSSDKKKKSDSDSSSGDDSDSSSSSGSDEKANGATAANTGKAAEKKDLAPADENDPNFGKTELFVQGLSFDTDENGLRNAFDPHGTLTKVKLIYGKGKAFVEFESHDQARAALAALNETEIDGRQVWIEFSGNPAGGYKPGASAGEATTIFCGNLSFKSD